MHPPRAHHLGHFGVCLVYFLFFSYCVSSIFALGFAAAPSKSFASPQPEVHMTDARLPHSVPALHRWNSIHGGRGDAAMKVQAFADRPQRPDEHEGIEYGLFLRKLWRRKFLLLAITVMGTGAAAAVIMRLPPHFVAHAYVSIGDPIARNRAATGVNQALGMAFPDTGTVKTEVEVLKSPQLALEVIRDLHLADDPEFNPALESSA